MSINHNLLVFLLSFTSICFELFLTRILSLKTYNHIVYVIIPFCLLGFGIGANFYLISREALKKFTQKQILATGLFALSFLLSLTFFFIIELPINIQSLTLLFKDWLASVLLIYTYTLVMLPYIVTGFLLLYLFSLNPQKSYKLYFWDLIGAGIGAAGFFFLINVLEVFHSIILLILATIYFGLYILAPRKKYLSLTIILFLFFISLHFIPEISNYRSHKDSGWENFPRTFHKNSYQTILRKWHPLGRTDVYRLKEKELQDDLYLFTPWTFQINLFPAPEYSYFVTNFLSGTPVYNLSPQGFQAYTSQLKLFSTGMETPYILFKNPKVVVIGAGGGRDIFTALTHNAKHVDAAEINPSIYAALTKGGILYNYSGGIYDQPNVNTFCGDGRYLVKNLPPCDYDLIVLNGVDTYSALSSGAYTFSESYLYTKEAIKDYLTLLKDNGVLNINRWLFKESPRETLRLFVIILDVLRSLQMESPLDHIIIGEDFTGGLVLVKKTPFLLEERKKIESYFKKMEMPLIFPRPSYEKDIFEPTAFIKYAEAFRKGKNKEFIKNYTYDISVVTDDNPFFYKYYRLKNFSFTSAPTSKKRGAGILIFLSQILSLLQTVFFIILFIAAPLILLKKDQLKYVPGNSPFYFISYFSCLGLGFMFVEIPLMQQFTLLLGSPIYSISVTLASLLIFSGIGSLSLKYLQRKSGNPQKLIFSTALTLSILLLLLMLFKEPLINTFIGLPLPARILLACIILLPIGICLGTFFPSGLQLINKKSIGLMPWAWGINFGFSVFGSMLSIVLAQFWGFKLIIILAIFSYLIAALSFKKLC